MKKMLLSLALALIVSLTLSSGFALAEDMEGSAAKEPAATEEPAPITVQNVGDTVADFALPDGLNGAPVKFSSDILGQADKLIALVFMNTSCSACQAEVSLMSRLAEKYGDKFKVYVIAVDMRGAQLVKGYDASYKYNVQYLLDPEFTIPPLFGFNYTPAMVLINKKGEILYKKGGYDRNTTDELVDEIKSHL